MDQFSSTRDFQIWDFYISFGQLLLRSVGNGESADSKNIDITFRGVFYLDIPATLSGVELDIATDDELAHLAARTGTPQDPTGQYHQYFVLVSKGNRYYVGAMDIHVGENTLDMMETSIGAAYQVPR